MTQDTTLKPCPCCGEEPDFENYIIEAVVRCNGCGLKIARAHAAKSDTGIAKAIAAWNARPAAPEIERLTRERDEARKLLSVDLIHQIYQRGFAADHREWLALYQLALAGAGMNLDILRSKEFAEAEAARLRSALADLINDVFGPEREPGEPVPEGLGIYELTTEAYLEREKRYRGALGGAQQEGKSDGNV